MTNRAMHCGLWQASAQTCGVCDPRHRLAELRQPCLRAALPGCRNRNSCYPHRRVRRHRPWRAPSSHVTSLPREMRPKRYLPEESKEIWSRLPTPCGLDRFFSLPGEIWSGMSVSSLSRRSLCGRTASHVPPCRPGEAASVGTCRAFTRKAGDRSGGDKVETYQVDKVCRSFARHNGHRGRTGQSVE